MARLECLHMHLPKHHMNRFMSAGLVCAALILTMAVACARAATVEFPGPQPGSVRSARNHDSFMLENRVISETWSMADGTLRPTRLVNKLTGESFDQTGTELFRLGLQAAAPPTNGVRVAIRLQTDKVVALASKDGAAWVELASFPRSEFPGEPKLVRLGKMNLKAEAKDYADLGSPGEGAIAEISPAVTTNRFAFKAAANQAAVLEYAFPAGTSEVSCRIDKGTDQGMSWSPALALVWAEGEKFLLVGLREQSPVFNLTTAAGEKMQSASLLNYPILDLPASDFKLVGEPKLMRLPKQPKGQREMEHFSGTALVAELVSPNGLHVHWQADLRDGANYLRQTVRLTSPQQTIPLYGVELADVRIPEPKTIGSVPGCPVAAAGMFFGVEMPGAENALNGTEARIGFASKLELSPTRSYSFGAVAGVAPAGQLRRAFLCYVERERARPSKPFLVYNCWYDLGYSLDEPSLVDVVKAFDTELVKKRGVPVQSYLVDDGWDSPDKGLWVENTDKFPSGLAGLKAKMDPLGAHLGIWISPLGGYGGAEERTAQAQKMGIIPAGASLDLAYPKYESWFENRCLQLMREDGVNAFKWDKAGAGVSPHFMALLEVAQHLRSANPDLFVTVTVGTWPSPFWLNHVDTTWRNGSADVGWSGKGDTREQWLTFRDGNCRHYFAELSPLYPLNSVMHHGIVHGRNFQGEKVGKSGPHLRNEARSYFATGAMLQELYLTPSMMTPEAWDQVAEAAKWAHANADVLVDAHWVGGNPLKLEPYGYAAWSPRKGTLMLRNPDDRARSITLDAQTVFELPAGAATKYALSSPYAEQRVKKLTLKAGQPATVELAPFEVLVFDANGK